MDAQPKPLNWNPEPGIGYHVARRADGGLHVTFKDTSPATLAHWREFALAHLFDSDRLTRNLYDLRQVEELPKDAINYALEVNADPSVRNIRLAVVAGNEQVRQAVHEVAALTAGGGVDLAVFTTIEEAEAWLDRPLTLLV